MITTIQNLKSAAYMGHTVKNPNGRKVSYWQLRKMDAGKSVEVEVSGTAASRVYTIK